MAISRQTVHREDVRRSNKAFYSLRDKQVQLYDIPAMNYLISEGRGEHSIYRMYDYPDIWQMGRFINRVKHYTVKDLGLNFSRMPMEMEWGDEPVQGIVSYRALLWIPSYITEEMYQRTIDDLRERLTTVEKSISMAKLPERTCAQLLHQGRHDDIGFTKRRLLDEIRSLGYSPQGRMQEIYMNHPRCNPPEKLQILLRQEVE